MPAMPTYTPLTPPDGAGNASNPNLHLGDGLVSVLKSDALGERRLLTLCFFFPCSFLLGCGSSVAHIIMPLGLLTGSRPASSLL